LFVDIVVESTNKLIEISFLNPIYLMMALVEVEE